MEITLLPVAIPGAAGLLALTLPPRLGILRTLLGVFATLATCVAGAYLVSGASTQVSFAGVTLPGGLAADAMFRVDAFSGWAVAFTGMLGFVTALYSAGWFRNRGGSPGRFHAWLLLAVAAAAGVLLADNLLLLLVCWEVVTLMLFLLVITVREEGGPSAAKAFTMLGLGDLALLVGIVLIGITEGTWSIRALDIATDTPLRVLAWLLFFVAASAKAGAMPFHTWIPTMSTGTHPAVMAFLPGSLDKVLGIYLLVRINLAWFAPTPALRLVIMIVGAVTILGAVFMAMVQHDLRRLLSYHAVSQVGYMLLGIGTGAVIGVVGGVFHMVNHAIYKACLFLGAGSVEREAGTMELGRLGGLVKTMPVTFACMFTAALAISGIPPLNGFVSKWFVYQACVEADVPILLIAALFGSALTLASFVKVLHSVFFGPRPERLDGVGEGRGGIGMPLAMITLAVLCVLLGVFSPWAVDTLFGPMVGESAELQGALDSALSILPLTALLALGCLAALILAFLGRIRSQRTRSVFVGGQVLDRNQNRYSGTEFYRTVEHLPGIGQALRAGDRGSFDPYVAGGRAGTPLVGLLRRLHTGFLTDYVVWCLLGLAILFAALALGR